MTELSIYGTQAKITNEDYQSLFQQLLTEAISDFFPATLGNKKRS